MELKTSTINTLPRLGWVAELIPERNEVLALHGTGVETGDRYLVEGCWPEDFLGANFHKSDCFFGSGLRILDNDVLAVPSRSLTDRLIIGKSPNRTIISNSLLLTLAATGSRLNETSDYRPFGHASLAGVNKYQRGLPNANPDINLEQIIYWPESLSFNMTHRSPNQSKQTCVRGFSNFREYERALLDTLAAIRDNCASPARSNRVSEWSTASTGYDSPAVTALAKKCGISQVYVTCGDRTIDGKYLEDSRSIADSLGMQGLPLTPRIPPAEMERLSLTGVYDGREMIFTDMLEQAAQSPTIGCLWSGYHGDKLWDRATQRYEYSSEILRGDTSGLNLSEIRLQSGFFNLVIPFIFAPDVNNLVAIANSPEMENWQIGGPYDRPIPRRIAETSGVPRDAFGQRKEVVMEYYTYPRNPALRNEYLQYLDSIGFNRLSRLLYVAAEHCDYRTQELPFISRVSLREAMRPGALSLDNSLYVWAVNTCVERLQRIMPQLKAPFKESVT